MLPSRRTSPAAFEPLDQQLVAGAAPLDRLPQRRDQLGLALQAQQVVAQVVAERAGVFGGVREQIVDRRIVGALLATMYSALRVRYGCPPISAYSRCDVGVAERPGMERVEAADLLGQEVLERQRDARR